MSTEPADARTACRTHVDLISGFLGAGKTTFIQKYCAWLREEGISFAVVENEFGAVGVDAAALKASYADIHELSGGCICCSMLPNFTELLLKLAGRYDRIIVEPSGIFDATSFFEIMELVRARSGAETGFCATIVDPRCLCRLQEEELCVLQSQLAGSSSVIYSKCDLPDLPELAVCGEFLRALAEDGALQIMETPAHLMRQNDFGTLLEQRAVLRPVALKKLNHAALFHCPSCKPDVTFTRAQLEWFLTRFLEGGAARDILRIKGTVRAAGGGYFAVNCTVCDCMVEEAETGYGILYFIMRGSPTAELRVRMDALFSSLPA